MTADASMPGENHNPVRLLSGRLLARNVVWSLIGEGLPLLVALWAIPQLIRYMGADRFGLLTIIWVGIGYFSLFDLGTGRALTKLVAERLGDGREAELPSLIRTGMTLMLALGGIAALAVLAATPWVTGSLLRIPPGLGHEAKWSFWILAATLPIVVSTTGLIGILQAHQRFATIAAVRVPMGVMNFLGPVLALAITPSLIATTLVLAACRVAGWLAYLWLSRDVRFVGEPHAAATRTAARELLSFGGWVTVSNIVGPLMVYCDRFVIGAFLTMTAVAYYTTPFSVITRLSVVSTAMLGVLFPAFTMALVVDPARAETLFLRATRLLSAAMLIPAAIVVLFAHEGLALWLNPTFARESSPVLRLLTVGVFLNSMARLPSAVVQGKGRPDLTGKLHLAELPVYGLMLWGLVKGDGIAGAAGAWTLRITLDTVALFVLGVVHVPELRRAQLRSMALTLAIAVLLCALTVVHGLWLRVGTILALVVFTGGWVFRDGMSILKGLGLGENGAAV